MDLSQYLHSKKIDAKSFAAAEPDRFTAWEKEFVEVSEASFTQQKLFLINGLRRRFPLGNDATTIQETGTKPKPKINIPKR